MGLDKVKEEIFLKCKRYCSICRKYKGRTIEIHHIVPRHKGGSDDFDNLMPVCPNCHEGVSYNPEHPRGSKFRESEQKRIRDEFYLWVENQTYGPEELNESDKDLLSIFINDYGNIIEYCIRAQFTAGLIDVDLGDKIDRLYNEKWTQKKYIFEDKNLENVKLDILNTLMEISGFLTDEFYRPLDGKLIFRNESFEEGKKLRETLQPNMLNFRQELNRL